MVSDLSKNTETERHTDVGLGMMLMMAGKLSSVDEMRDFINGFN